MDYETWAIEMATLLDRIEFVADDEEAVRKLCAGRFDIAERCGFDVIFTGPQTSSYLS